MTPPRHELCHVVPGTAANPYSPEQPWPADDALRQLTPVQFVYNDDVSNEKRVGFIAEDVPEIVANKDRKSVPIMDVVALVTRVVKDQQQTIDEQKKSIEETNRRQQKTIDELIKRLVELENQASARK